MIKRQCQFFKGFTFLEVLSAVVLLGVISVAVMGMYRFGNQANALTEDRLMASTLLQRMIEETKSLKFITNTAVNGTFFSGYPNYVFDITEQDNYINNSSMKKIDIQMTWQTPLGTMKTKTVPIIVSDRQ